MTLYGTSVTRAKEAALHEDLFQMRKAIDEVLRRQAEVSVLTRCARSSEKYLREIKPDPFTRSVDTLADDDVGAGRGQSLG